MQPANPELNLTAPEHSGRLDTLRRMARKHGGPLAALFVRVAAAGLAYVLQITLARYLGAEDYGVFAYAWAWVTIAGFGSTFGFSQIGVRFLAEYSEHDKPALALGFIRTGLAVVGIGAVALAIGGSAYMNANPDMFGARYTTPLLLMLVTVPLFAIGDLAEGYARSHGWSLLALAPPYILRQLLLIAAIPAVYLMGIQPTATIAMGAALLATLVAAVLQLHVTLRRLLATLPAGIQPRYALKTWCSAAWPVFLGDVAQVLRQNVDIIVLAMYVEPGQLALYFAATRVASMLGLIEFAVGAAAAHRFARIRPDSGTDELRHLARQSANLTFWPTLIAAGGLALLATPVLALFGAAYVDAAPLVLIMALGFVLRAAIGPAEEFLMMRGHSRAVMLAQFLGLETTALLCWRFVPEQGATGAALGVLGALAVTTLVLAICCRRLTGVVPLPMPSRNLPTRKS